MLTIGTHSAEAESELRALFRDGWVTVIDMPHQVMTLVTIDYIIDPWLDCILD